MNAQRGFDTFSIYFVLWARYLDVKRVVFSRYKIVHKKHFFDKCFYPKCNVSNKWTDKLEDVIYIDSD